MFREIRLKKKKGLSLIEMLLALAFFSIINGFLITMLSFTLKMWTVTYSDNMKENNELNVSLYLKREIENQKNLNLLVREDLIEIERSDKKIILSSTKGNLKVKYIDEWGRKLKENIIMKNIEKIEFKEKGELLYIILSKDGDERHWVFQRKEWVDF
ncbi:hypothetical protein [Oceanirhabdus seepicola]|uniref:Uncharacterized protein n=1 Tax=Oceanirhabdus seepicola TaxID=2828781 RepID=A0A9J6P748_9CLOT|nr:hypothetical protein [Oceanirhabdus seepicola]MCM1992730.1 hypothetical protein [Oceanirhabdus seepicola]